MKTIFLIEDDYLDIESIKRSFKKLNIEHNLYVAHNGIDAINLLTKEKGKITPDIILLDINMPKMNGLEFLQIIKNYYSLKNIKIFVITSSGEEYDKIATQHLGVMGYILKPLDFKNTTPDTLKLLSYLEN